MKHTLEEINARFAELRVEWNASEELVKSAEQVCGDAVIPSIKEFRYAGRRIVDAFHEMASGGDLMKADAFIQDAIFNCHCARHDAIDVASGIIASNLAVAVDKIGYQHILAVFQDFAELRRILSSIRGKIRNSRANRTDRDAIYLTIHKTEFPRLIELYDEYQSAEDIMRSLARSQRREIVFLRATTVFALVVATASCIFSGYEALKPREAIAAVAPGTPAVGATTPSHRVP
jgi:hypothetical protein